jgi:type I restriction enzyme S subunit
MFYKETAFQETAIGKIPVDWKVVRIGEMAKTEAGGTPSTFHKEYWNGNVPWINSGELENRLIQKPTTYITDLGLANSAAKLLPSNSVLIAARACLPMMLPSPMLRLLRMVAYQCQPSVKASAPP